MMVLFLGVLSPRLAKAYCVYNAEKSDRTVMIAQLQNGEDFITNTQYLEAFSHGGWSERFVTTLEPGGKSCCNWKNEDCNKGEGRGTSLIFAAIDQGDTGRSENYNAQLCYKVIPAGGALVVTARSGDIFCKEGSHFGRGHGYYHQLNSLSWEMRRTYYDHATVKTRKDEIDWSNVFPGGRKQDGSIQGVCRGYLTPGDRGLLMKIVRGKVNSKEFRSLLLGRLEGDICIGELFGRLVRFDNFEYLTRNTKAKWVKSDGSRASARNAMYAGVDWTGALLNICRVNYKGAIHVGKQWSDQCYIGVEDKGIGVKAPFEILVSH